MDLLLRLLTCIEPPQPRQDVLNVSRIMTVLDWGEERRMNPQAAVCWGGIPRVGRRLSGKLEGRGQGGAEGCSEIGRDSDFAGLRFQMCTPLGFWDASLWGLLFPLLACLSVG